MIVTVPPIPPPPPPKPLYRPITCLNIMYKVYTDMMTGYELLPDEQKALRKSTRGCMDALTIDEAVYREIQVNGGGWRLECLPTGLCHITSCYPPPPLQLSKNSLSVAWVDFRKAFDMTPHQWILDMLHAI